MVTLVSGIPTAPWSGLSIVPVNVPPASWLILKTMVREAPPPTSSPPRQLPTNLSFSCATNSDPEKARTMTSRMGLNRTLLGSPILSPFFACRSKTKKSPVCRRLQFHSSAKFPGKDRRRPRPESAWQSWGAERVSSHPVHFHELCIHH